MVACFKAQKSPQDFIKLAFSVNQIVSGAKFILVGDGALRKPVEDLIKRFGLTDKIILTCWRRDVHRLLPAFDICVLTSLWEGMPVSALEAMASSKPLVATQTGGIQEIVIEGKTGFLVPRGNLKTMSEKLGLLLKDERLRKEMGKNARDFLGPDFQIQNMVKKSQDLYENLICRKEQKNVN
jgi:glycosyltransferase involved in cell wall biosynthesis